MAHAFPGILTKNQAWELTWLLFSGACCSLYTAVFSGGALQCLVP